MSDAPAVPVSNLDDWLETRRVSARKARLANPGFGSCYRCGMPWSSTKSHSTWFDNWHGCFPLCEECWSQLTPETRLPYYRNLYMDWERMGGAMTSWPRIEASVLAGG